MASPDLYASHAVPDAGVDPATVLRLRQAVYSHDELTPADVELIFAVARKARRQSCPEWTGLFCEALTDYVVHQNDPRDYIAQDKADWLTTSLTRNGGVATKAEFAMLIDVMTHALGVPTSLSSFALREIQTAIIEGRRDAFHDEDHPAGVVTKADVEALRAVLYAAKSGTAEHVTKEEAEALFAIAHATAHARNDPSFDDLFARAVGNYLMAIHLDVPDAAEALQFEKWLDEKETLPGFLARMLHRAPEGGSLNVLESPSEAYEADLARRDAAESALRSESEKITEPKAAWVIAHLTRDGELTSAETRLLQFLGAEAASIAPSLQAFIAKAKAAGGQG
jgi:hypothetical protein